MYSILQISSAELVPLEINGRTRVRICVRFRAAPQHPPVRRRMGLNRTLWQFRTFDERFFISTAAYPMFCTHSLNRRGRFIERKSTSLFTLLGQKQGCVVESCAKRATNRPSKHVALQPWKNLPRSGLTKSSKGDCEKK